VPVATELHVFYSILVLQRGERRSIAGNIQDVDLVVVSAAGQQVGIR
jgi:hypothetical protein